MGDINVASQSQENPEFSELANPQDVGVDEGLAAIENIKDIELDKNAINTIKKAIEEGIHVLERRIGVVKIGGYTPPIERERDIKKMEDLNNKIEGQTTFTINNEKDYSDILSALQEGINGLKGRISDVKAGGYTPPIERDRDIKKMNSLMYGLKLKNNTGGEGNDEGNGNTGGEGTDEGEGTMGIGG